MTERPLIYCYSSGASSTISASSPLLASRCCEFACYIKRANSSSSLLGFLLKMLLSEVGGWDALIVVVYMTVPDEVEFSVVVMVFGYLVDLNLSRTSRLDAWSNMTEFCCCC